jgi:DnaK suppressor protein
MTDHQLSELQIQGLRQELLESKDALEDQINLSTEATGVVVLDQTAVGRVSRVDAMQQQSMAVSTKAKAITKLKKVAEALSSIKNGDYGYCRRCDEPIASARLAAKPEANLCILCQDKLDRQQ